MKIRHLYISAGHNFLGHHDRPPGEHPVESVPEIECVAGRGIRGDRYFDHKDDYKGQVTFFSEEVYEDLCGSFGVFDRDPSVFRRNIVVSGVDLNTLIDREFEVQGVRFSGSCEASPCYWMNRVFHEGAEEALRGRGGLRARILGSGVLKVDP